MRLAIPHWPHTKSEISNHFLRRRRANSPSAPMAARAQVEGSGTKPIGRPCPANLKRRPLNRYDANNPYISISSIIVPTSMSIITSCNPITDYYTPGSSGTRNPQPTFSPFSFPPSSLPELFPPPARRKRRIASLRTLLWVVVSLHLIRKSYNPLLLVFGYPKVASRGAWPKCPAAQLPALLDPNCRM